MATNGPFRRLDRADVTDGSGDVVVHFWAPWNGYDDSFGQRLAEAAQACGALTKCRQHNTDDLTSNWTGMIGQLSKSRRVIAVEMQGHGRTADVDRDFSYENLADDVAALLDHLKIERADVLGYSMGGGVAMQVAIRHPDKVRKVVSLSAVFRHDGWVKEAVEAFPRMDAAMSRVRLSRPSTGS